MGCCYLVLSAEERGAIMAMRQQGLGVRGMARALNRSPSAIGREILRNGRGAGEYDAASAGRQARRVRHKGRRRLLDPDGALWKKVLGFPPFSGHFLWHDKSGGVRCNDVLSAASSRSRR